MALRWSSAAAIFGVILSSTVASAQTSGTPLAFAAASIRRNVDNKGTCDPSQVQPTRNGIHMTNCPLLVAIGAAYVPTSGNPLGYLVEDRIVGMPGWVTQERYDVEARIADADDEAWRDPVRRVDMLHAMMQALLAERCKLLVHREMRDKPVYALVVAKNGANLKSADASSAQTIRASRRDAVDVPDGGGFFVRGPANGHIDLYGGSLGTLALLLSGATGRPVLDRTGLTGTYDMHLDMGQPGPGSSEGAADAGASVFRALQEQLGLKLESRKVPVEHLVVDHVERPTAN